METSLDSLVSMLWSAVGASVVGVVARLVQRGSSLLLAQEANIRSASVRDALEYATTEAATAAQTIVTSLNQTVVGQLKSQGRWNEAAASAVKAKAVALLKQTLSAEAKDALTRAVADLNAYLDTLVEANVAVSGQHAAPAVAPVVAPVVAAVPLRHRAGDVA